jgi:hypothetical protein
MVKPLWGNIHDPSQHDHLEQFINAKKKITERFYKRYWWILVATHLI